MDTIDQNRRRLLQACGAIGGAAMAGLSLNSQAAETELISLAAQLERVAPWSDKKPPLVS